jgi:hypothetical protein
MSQPIEDLPGQTYIPGTEPTKKPPGVPRFTDVKGRAFSPSLHKISPDGNPIVRQGRLVLKGGYPAGKPRRGERGKAAPAKPAKEGKADPGPEAEAQGTDSSDALEDLGAAPDGESTLGDRAPAPAAGLDGATGPSLTDEEIELAARHMARQLEMAHQMAFGEEGKWTPEERVGVIATCKEYVRQRGCVQLPPELALVAALGAIAFARRERPKHATIWERAGKWLKGEAKPKA